MDDAAARSIVSKFGEMRSDLAAASGRLADLAAEESEHGLVAKALEPMEAGRRCWRLVRRERDGTSASARESAGSQPPPPFCSSPPQNALSASPPSKVGDVLVERTVGEVLPAVQSNQAQIGEVIARGERGAGRGGVGGGAPRAHARSAVTHTLFPSPSPSLKIVNKLRADVAAKEKALAEYAQKHGIRVRDGPPPAAAPTPPQAAAGKGEGVLV